MSHVIADANKRMDEDRRIEEDIYRKRKVQMSENIFLTDRGKMLLGFVPSEAIYTLIDKEPLPRLIFWLPEGGHMKSVLNKERTLFLRALCLFVISIRKGEVKYLQDTRLP